MSITGCKDKLFEIGKGLYATQSYKNEYIRQELDIVFLTELIQHYKTAGKNI